MVTEDTADLDITLKPVPRMPEVGEAVVWHNPVNRAHNALVTAVWSATCINVVVVSSDPNRDDSYGRQIERQTSQMHGSQQPAHGNYWRWPEEEPNSVIALDS